MIYNMHSTWLVYRDKIHSKSHTGQDKTQPFFESRAKIISHGQLMHRPPALMQLLLSPHGSCKDVKELNPGKSEGISGSWIWIIYDWLAVSPRCSRSQSPRARPALGQDAQCCITVSEVQPKELTREALIYDRLIVNFFAVASPENRGRRVQTSQKGFVWQTWK